MNPYDNLMQALISNYYVNKYKPASDALKPYYEEQVRKVLKRGAPYSNEEIRLFAHMAGPDKNGHSLLDDGDWEDESVADAYAEHLQNYIYQYTPEAQQIDPRIDPSEEQIGIMAQDLEKVNPACVKEVNGVKTVDTQKLALMNAGAIADLARRLDTIEEILNGKE